MTTSARPLLLAAATAAGAAVLAARVDHRRRARRAAGPRWRVVVIGAGFGGLHAARRLARSPDVDLTVIDTQNHHLFQPLLYQVATAALSPTDIASPVRGIIPATGRARVLMRTVTGVDAQARAVLCGDDAVPYDALVLATGSKPSYFGHPAWADAAPGLKTLDDALLLRRTLLASFEQAVAADRDGRERLLTVVLVGGGPTGVEMAGSIAELVRDLLPRDYGLRADAARIVLVEAGPHLLPGFAPDLSANAAAVLAGLGVEVRTGARVTAIEDGTVRLGDEAIAAATIIWAAGTAATPVAEWLGVEGAKDGRVAVDGALRPPGHARVHVIGDAALARGPDGQPLPALAPVAKQQGDYAARAILRRLRGRPAPGPFRYRDYGALATIGRGQAVAEFGPVHLTGLPGWLTWAIAHIFFLIGFRNRVLVSAQWAFAYLAHERSGRLLVRPPAWQNPAERGGQPPVAKPG